MKANLPTGAYGAPNSNVAGWFGRLASQTAYLTSEFFGHDPKRRDDIQVWIVDSGVGYFFKQSDDDFAFVGAPL